MKILLSSHLFPPSIGGIEEVSSILAHEFARRRHEVIVVTQTMGKGTFPFEVRRRPPLARLPGLTRWSDVVFHNNISLRTAWPLAAIRRPWIIAHQTWIARPDGRRAPVDRLKLRAIRRARNVAVSRAIAAKLGVESRVIPNPYRDEVFRATSTGPRTGDVIFLGRLVSDKGVDLLLDALAILKARRPQLRAAIVGDGPERPALEAQGRRLDLDVTFTGSRRGDDLVALLNRHRLLVVPSRWEEPFGIVAIEGMACGCIPVVARAGGLPEAVDAAGVTFETGNPRALADCIEGLLGDENRMAELRDRAPAHLERHRASAIAAQYLELFEEALR